MALPTIFKASSYNSPTVYENGAIGNINKDGSVKINAVYNANRGYIEINLNNVNFSDKIKCIYREYGGSSIGIFRLKNSSGHYLSLRGGGTVGIKNNYSTSEGAMTPATTSQYATIFEWDGDGISTYTQVNGQTGSRDASSSFREGALTTLNLFKSDNWSGKIEIISFEIENKLKLSAAFKNGVAGFYDELSETFFGDYSGYNELYPMYYE